MVGEGEKAGQHRICVLVLHMSRHATVLISAPATTLFIYSRSAFTPIPYTYSTPPQIKGLYLQRAEMIRLCVPTTRGRLYPMCEVRGPMRGFTSSCTRALDENRRPTRPFSLMMCSGSLVGVSSFVAVAAGGGGGLLLLLLEFVPLKVLLGCGVGKML